MTWVWECEECGNKTSSSGCPDCRRKKDLERWEEEWRREKLNRLKKRYLQQNCPKKGS